MSNTYKEKAKKIIEYLEDIEVNENTKLKINIHPFKEGDGIEFKIYGYEGSFKLCLYLNEDIYKKYVDIGFYNSKHQILASVIYSGGNTKFGIDSFGKRQNKDIEILTTDLNVINEITKYFWGK